MNWDWEKLQEKRQGQGNKGSFPGGPPKNPFKGVQFKLPKFGSGLPIKIIAGGLLLLWLASGIFIVNPGSIGVVLQFGQFNRLADPGPHYRWPSPLETHIVVNHEAMQTVTIGQSSAGGARQAPAAPQNERGVWYNQRAASSGSPGVSQDESTIFTGDENLVHMQFNVQFNIKDAQSFLFNVKDPIAMVSAAAEAAMREVVGGSSIDTILTDRTTIQLKAQESLQGILDTYQSGIAVHIVQILDASPPNAVAAEFRDVANAREDKERFTNEAQAYYNSIVPVANGTAKSIVNAAEAYRQSVVLGAEGEASHFAAIAAEYAQSKEIMVKRLYLEAMGDILSATSLEKVVLPKGIGGKVLPFLNLNQSDSARLPIAPEVPGTAGGGAGR